MWIFCMEWTVTNFHFRQSPFFSFEIIFWSLRLKFVLKKWTLDPCPKFILNCYESTPHHNSLNHFNHSPKIIIISCYVNRNFNVLYIVRRKNINIGCVTIGNIKNAIMRCSILGTKYYNNIKKNCNHIVLQRAYVWQSMLLSQ